MGQNKGRADSSIAPLSAAIPIFCTGLSFIFPVLFGMALSGFIIFFSIVCYILLSCLFYYAAYRCQNGSPWSLAGSAVCCVLVTLILISPNSAAWELTQTIVLLLSIFLGLYLLGYIAFRRYMHRPLQLCRWLLSIRYLLYLCLMFPICDVLTDFYCQMSDMNISNTVVVEEQEHTEVALQDVRLADNLERLAPLADDAQWAELSQDEKLEILNVILQIERTYLGIPYELTLTVKSLSNGDTGSFSPSDQCVAIAPSQLEFPWESVQTICHESFHAYEQTIVELYNVTPETYRNLLLFDSAPTWAAEFANYIESSEDTMDEYYEQEVEIAARNYAELAALDYSTRLDDYLTKQDEE